MVKRSLLRETLCGLLLGLMILSAQPAQAQWATFDASAYTQRIKSELKRLHEWTEKIRQYQTMYINGINQLTTLKGMLQLADKTLAKNKELALLTNDISEIIRGSYQLQNQVKNMTRYQVAALQQIDDRLNNGIFDPDKDLADFEEYLIYSMGRNSRQTVRLMVETANADVLIQGWMAEKQGLEKQLAEANEKLKALKKRLDIAQGNKNIDPESTQPLNEAILQTKLLIATLKEQISELNEKITTRASAYGIRLSDMENFGYQIESTKMAWAELQKTKDEIAKTFDASILQMQPEQ